MAAVFASCVFKNPARYHFVLNYGKGGWQEKNMQQASYYYLCTDIGEEERVVNECQRDQRLINLMVDSKIGNISTFMDQAVNKNGCCHF